MHALACLSGDFNKPIQSKAFDQAHKEVPWHLDLNKQCPKLQVLFTERLSEIYKGHWNPKHMKHEVGANL